MEQGNPRPKQTADGPAVTSAVGFEAIFKEELQRSIVARRRIHVEAGSLPKSARIDEEKWASGQAPPADLAGLALSGGGIRSATFNLGFLQALARYGRMPWFDYLSTVSGGGYIGSCLTSLLCGAESGVTRETFPFRFEGRDERPEIRHLRNYGSYLAPRHGLLRLDTWKLVSAYLMGLGITIGTFIALLGVAASFLIWVYPRILWLPGYLGYPIMEAGHDIWDCPSDHKIYLFGPAALVLLLWTVLVLFYVARSVRNWKFEWRQVRMKWQGRLLQAAAFLAVIGALPLALHLTELETDFWRNLRANLWGPLWSTFGASALSLIWSNLLGQAAPTRGARVKRWVVLLGAWTFSILFCLIALYAVYHNRHDALRILFISALVLAVLALLADINRISMYYFYRDRLSDAYIITRQKEEPLHLVPNDSQLLSDVDSWTRGGPYPLINATLNLPGSENPVLHGRRADFFLFSPLYCGSPSTGYAPTHEFEHDRVSLASAMAVSGAATNPEYGPRTNPALAFLMALVNARLGVWSQNPRYDLRKFPLLSRVMRFWPYYLLRELLRASDELSHTINISDGGHIENLGVYELLRRRCRLIVASDAGADPERGFQDLGNLIRKARIDLGIIIDIDVEPLRPSKESGLSAAHVVTGTIRYPNQAGGRDIGRLIYVKTALVQGDAQDLHDYHRRHLSFPHQSTVDQFFDEEQFESYRELGYRSGMALIDLVDKVRIAELGPPEGFAPPAPPAGAAPQGAGHQ